MTHFFIDRPIFATVLSIVIVIVGVVAALKLPIAQYPEVAPPTVNVSTVYPGANAKVVAETVATPIEQEVNGVENMLYMSSRSTNDGRMNLDVTFDVGTNLDMAQVLVQNRVAVAQARLPEEVKRQGVTTKKKSPNILLLVNMLSPGGRRDMLYLSNYATLNVKDELARIEGVGDVQVLGARDYSMRVWLDPGKMAARGLNAGDVVRALREQNVQEAAGRLGQEPAPPDQEMQLTINTLGRLSEPDQFADIVVKTGSDGRVTYLRDLVVDPKTGIQRGATNYDLSSYLDGQPTVTLAVFQMPGSNAVETARLIHDKMKDLKQKKFPAEVAYEIVYDTTLFIDESIRSVFETLIEAIILVFLVVLVFLQDWRATVIPMVAVPVSLVGTFALMALFGFSLNNLSMFGLVLAIGIVVDDAIVVVENVDRNIAAGLSPRDATRKAMDEVTGPVIATSLVMGAVFIPCAMLAGISGQFFRQFALTIVAAVFISTFNSLTMSPALCALILKGRTAKKDWFTRIYEGLFGWFFRAFNWGFDRSAGLYGQAVGWLLRGAVIVLAVYGGLLGLTYLGFRAVPRGFVPQQDKGYLMANVQLPDGAALGRTTAVVERVDRSIRKTRGVAHTITVPGYSVLAGANLANVGTVFVVLDPFDVRGGRPELGAPAILADLRQKLAGEREALVALFGAPPIDGLGSTGGFKLQVQDRSGSGDFANLEGAAQRLVAAGDAQPGLVGLFSSYSANQPQLFVDVDRVKAKAQGIALSDVFGTLQTYLGSAYANDFAYLGRNWQVNVQADARYRLTPDDIGKLEVRNDAGQMVPLSTLTRVEETSGPAIVSHYQLYPSADVSGGTQPGTSSGQAIDLMDELAAENLGQGMDYEWTELSLQQIIAEKDLLSKLVFPLAVVFVFLTLAAQYESWSLPLAIILIVPMCMLCALGTLWALGWDNNIFTQIGLVVLVGLAAKNAILIVEFAKQREDAGLSRFDAALEASRLRFRPILMTAFSFILGVIPLIVATGAGFEMRRALGTAVFSGMLGVTVFGVFFTPVFYLVIRWLAARGAAPARPQPAPSAPPEPMPDAAA